MIKCYVFAVGGLPDPILHPKQARKVMEFFQGLKGLTGIHLYDRYHTLLVFETLNQAKIARSRIYYEKGNAVGKNILEAELTDDKQHLTVMKKAEE